MYNEFKYFQRTLSSFILDSMTVYATYHLMRQIKEKELTSLLLSISILNTLCAPARVFHLEQGSLCDFFSPFLPCRYVEFFIIHASMLSMPLLTPKTSVPLFTIPGVKQYQSMLIIRGPSIKYLQGNEW